MNSINILIAIAVLYLVYKMMAPVNVSPMCGACKKSG
jgi:hypothetical protein